MPHDADVGQQPDHGYGALGQATGALLADTDLSDRVPVVGLLYNVAARAPGPPSYAVAPTDREMWECTPSTGDALDLMAQITRTAAVNRPPGSKPAPLSHFRIDPRKDRRLDGIVLAYRAWAGDPRSAASKALFANVVEGYYRRGDVAALAERIDIYTATAVGRDGTKIALARLPGGPVQRIGEAFGLDEGLTPKLVGREVARLAALLTALLGRPDLRC